MKIKFLGTGTSHGVPVVGCNCATCTSNDPKNTRYRTSILVTDSDTSILVDMSPEFRLRALEYKIPKVEAILFTHAHSDHCSGLDDIRRYNEMQKQFIPVYGNNETLADLKKRFYYIFDPGVSLAGKPNLKLEELLDYQFFQIGNINIQNLPVLHGKLKVSAFRFHNIAYITDVSSIPEETYNNLKDLDLLVLDALRIDPHPTHFTLDQALAAAKRINAKKTYFTHMSHALEHNATEKILPENMFLAYDGLELNLPD